MAVVKGVKEKIHLPLYDSVTVKPNNTLGATQSSNILRFFQDVTGKTKLETNMQASSLLPHWNTFEARALRVVISDLAPEYPDKPVAELAGLTVLNADGTDKQTDAKLAAVHLGHLVTLSRRLEASGGVALELGPRDLADLGLVLRTGTGDPLTLTDGERLRFGQPDLANLRQALAANEVQIPPDEQILPANGCGNVISRFIYNTVTTFYVGEKVMIQVPTWFFPSGAGPYAEDGKVVTHGYPSPQATFRFAEPIFVDTQQNFRVEIEIPEGEVFARLKRLYGPLFIWVVIDGFMTRDVQ